MSAQRLNSLPSNSQASLIRSTLPRLWITSSISEIGTESTVATTSAGLLLRNFTATSEEAMRVVDVRRRRGLDVFRTWTRPATGMIAPTAVAMALVTSA